MHHDSGTAASGAGMATKKRQAASAPARLRRMYIDCRYGQMHLTTAYPASGGFDEASPIVFLHGEDGSGADFSRCAAILGTDRSVYAPDLPGSGGSDSPKGRMAIAGLALAVADLFEQLRLRRVDLVGCGRGARSRTSLRPRGQKRCEGWSLREHSSPQLPSPSQCCSFPPIRAGSCKSRPRPSRPRFAPSSTGSSPARQPACGRSPRSRRAPPRAAAGSRDSAVPSRSS